jgi:hypothetical protein
MNWRLKPICHRGHDTTITGRYKVGGCIACAKDPSRKTQKRNARLLYLFGISLEDYNRMFAEQKGLCLGCYTHQSALSKSLAVDHDHKTGKVRGLLCFRCNAALGCVKDNTQILERLIGYLNVRSASQK